MIKTWAMLFVCCAGLFASGYLVWTAIKKGREQQVGGADKQTRSPLLFWGIASSLVMIIYLIVLIMQNR